MLLDVDAETPGYFLFLIIRSTKEQAWLRRTKWSKGNALDMGHGTICLLVARLPRQAVDKFRGDRPIDRLVCNAAVYQPTLDYPKWTVDGHEQQLQINYLRLGEITSLHLAISRTPIISDHRSSPEVEEIKFWMWRMIFVMNSLRYAALCCTYSLATFAR